MADRMDGRDKKIEEKIMRFTPFYPENIRGK